MSTTGSHSALRALEAAQATHPDLADLLAFYRDLYVVQYAARSQMRALSSPDPDAIRRRAEAGHSQLTFDDLTLDPVSFGVLVSDVLGVLARHNRDWRPTPPGPDSDLVRRARLVFERWDTLTAPREEEEHGIAGTAGPGSLIDQAVALALAAHLQHAAEAILPVMDPVLWRRPMCPICGGRPNLALLAEESGARQLVCSRCDSLWGYTRVGCPFCGSQERQTYFLGQGGLYRLYVCPDCKRYLKTVDLRFADHPVLPAVERLLSVGMDLAARQEGYRG